MSLGKGDHLVIKRGDKIIGPADEAYHEFEVMDFPSQCHAQVLTEVTTKRTAPDGTSAQWTHVTEADADQRPFYLLPSGIRIVA